MSDTTTQMTKSDLDALAKQAVEAFVIAAGPHTGARLAHAKGLVCHGTFEPTPEAAKLSRAAHFRGGAIPVVVRFSNASGIPVIPDGDPNASPKGLAIRFTLPDGKITDIVSNAGNGFVAATPADFVAFLQAAVASGAPGVAKPTPLEQFLGAHPATAALLGQPNPTPTSFGAEAYFGNNAFLFVDETGRKQATRYKIVPVAGESDLDAETAAKQPPNFLFDEVRARLPAKPVEFRLTVQLPGPGDSTSDATKVWPPDRPAVDLGLIRVTSVDPQSDQAQHALTFDPTHLIDGIELSDDPLPAFRAVVYGLSIARRWGKA